jgi:hypothetical protein
MKREIDYIISSENQDMSIESFLRKKHYTSKSLIKLKKTKEGVKVNGKWEYLVYKLRENDNLKITILEDEVSENIIAVFKELNIIYEDKDLMIIDKAADTPIHPSINNYENTLANAVRYYMKMNNEEFVFRCINRLDRNTTGLTIIAKNYLSSGILYNDMKERKISRTYIGILRANEVGVKLPLEGKIDLPIGRKSDSCIERCVDKINGERAITNFKLIERKNDYYLVEFNLETGRTHQIRVHTSYLGFQLIGDEMYGGDLSLIKRTALHSKKLSFRHPILDREMHFEVAIPKDMFTAWEKIKRA